MKIGEKEIEIKDLADTVKCNRKVIEHIRKRQEADSSTRNKSQPQESIKLSDQEKCFRTTFVRAGLFTFCAMGLGKYICESYDMIKDEEKKLGKRSTDNEVYQIIIDIAKKYKIIPENYTNNMLESK